jgi:hypothetical protein
MFLEELQLSFYFLLYFLLRGAHQATPDKTRQSLLSAQAKIKNFLRGGHARGDKFLLAAGVDSKAEMPGTIADPKTYALQRLTIAEVKILHAKLQKSN